MICILKFADPTPFAGPELTHTPGDEIDGWIIATDLHDARRQAHGAMDHALSSALYRMEFEPSPGKYPLGSGHVLLVS